MNDKQNTTKKNKRNWLICIISIAIVGLGIVSAIIFGNQKPSIEGFEENLIIDDSISVEMAESVQLFDISKALAIGNITAPETASDIESFKRLMEMNRQEAESLNEGKIVIPKIVLFFDFNSAELNASSLALLEEYARMFGETNQEALIQVEGFACNIGTKEANDFISRKRAENVQKVLEQNGVLSKCVEVKWYGKSRNVEFNYEYLSQYRRVEVSIK
ncbi:MAG: OmpA family protein [Bacteroidales bacterium]|nr:OmpA family protein [Bacteroidales bacterium]